MNNPTLMVCAWLLLLSLGIFVYSRQLPHALLAFGLSFTLLSAIYIAQNALFIGLVQFLLYVGGLLVLFAYGLMLSDRNQKGQWTSTTHQPKKALWVLMGLALWLFLALIQMPMLESQTSYPMPDIAQIGLELLTQYALFLELTGLLLLLILIATASLLSESKHHDSSTVHRRI